MESPNQDAMLNEQSKTVSPDTGGTGAVSGSPNMEPDTTSDGYGNGDTMGNNDGTESDPESTDPTADQMGTKAIS